ncbi:PAQR family membrane homeostasis protein TrhA [Tautonia marina]|uniref:PAQR family membrane homeostasis protein TrhA n=1 Tax=Tautonia marina TaxID=2653855 RepID=UPI00126135CB|nr:hemolysin III family protein [Tautonia marina]
MNDRKEPEWRPWTKAEELANAVSHGLGFVAAILVFPLLIDGALNVGGTTAAVAAAIFGTTMVVVYLSSALHHALPEGQTKRTIEVVDRAAIFLLIAGTYTPFALGVLRGTWGWVLLATVWSLAIYGIVRTIAAGTIRPYQGTKLYLVMGWLILLVVGPVTERMDPRGLALLVAGGMAYTIGVGFYASHRMKFHHLVWHVFVMAGSACHVLATLWYAVV